MHSCKWIPTEVKFGIRWCKSEKKSYCVIHMQVILRIIFFNPYSLLRSAVITAFLINWLYHIQWCMPVLIWRNHWSLNLKNFILYGNILPLELSLFNYLLLYDIHLLLWIFACTGEIERTWGWTLGITGR